MLSGNRNFEARIHQNIKANFLMSPPLVVAFGLAGTVDIDMTKDPLGTGKDGKPVFLRTSGRRRRRSRAVMKYATDPAMLPASCYSATSPKATRCGTRSRPRSAHVYEWDAQSTYVHQPPYFDDFRMKPGKP